MARERKYCPECNSSQINKVFGKSRSKKIPPELKGVPHYRCCKCKARFTIPVVSSESKQGVKLSSCVIDVIEKAYKDGLTDGKIADKAGVCTHTVYTWRSKNGLQSNYRKKTTSDKAVFMWLYKKGKNDRQIAKELDVCPSNVSRWRKEEGLPSNSPIGTPVDKSGFMAMYLTGAHDDDMAKEFNCSRTTIVDWRNSRGLELNGAKR